MIGKIEGILISKIPYQEKHFIGKLILRNGKKATILFYGGRGSLKSKSSYLDLGHMIDVALVPYKKDPTMVKSKEWSLIWAPKKVRSSINLFFLLCFYMEVVDKIAPSHDFEDEDYSDLASEGIFRVLSNALYFLENREGPKKQNELGQMTLFLGKLLLHQGLFPTRDICCFCGESLHHEKKLLLLPDHGGFSCASCFDNSERKSLESEKLGKMMHCILGEISLKKYKNFSFREGFNATLSQSLFHYFCYQYQLLPKGFKSLKHLGRKAFI